MRGVFGGLLMGIGILIAGLSGLCTVVGVGAMLFDPGSMGNAGEMVSVLGAVLLFGGVPFLIGLGLFFAGRHLLKDQRQPPPELRSNRPPEPDGMARPDPTRERGDLS
jgi:hypothetical protein